MVLNPFCFTVTIENKGSRPVDSELVLFFCIHVSEYFTYMASSPRVFFGLVAGLRIEAASAASVARQDCRLLRLTR